VVATVCAYFSSYFLSGIRSLPSQISPKSITPVVALQHILSSTPSGSGLRGTNEICGRPPPRHALIDSSTQSIQPGE